MMDDLKDDAAAAGVPGDAHRDLSHAGAVVEKTIEHLLEQRLDPMAVASALLAGALGLLMQTVGTAGTGQVLAAALASVKAGDLSPKPQG